MHVTTVCCAYATLLILGVAGQKVMAYSIIPYVVDAVKHKDNQLNASITFETNPSRCAGW